MKRLLSIFFFFFMISLQSLDAQEWPVVYSEYNPSLASMRYVPAPGGPKELSITVSDTLRAVIGRHYAYADTNVLKGLGQRECATFWYDIFTPDDGEHFVIRAHSKRFALGISGTYWFGSSPFRYNAWQNGGYTDVFQEASHTEWNYTIGVHLGLQIFAANRHRLTLEFLPAYGQSIGTFSMDHYQTSYPAVDPDGCPYERHVTVENYRERVSGHTLSLPVNLRYDWYFHKKVSVFAAGGIDNRLLVARRSAADFDGYYAGQYGSELFNIFIDRNGYYDFGSFDGVHLEQRSVQDSRYSLLGVVTLGFQFFVGDRVSVDFAGLYASQFLAVPKSAAEVYCLSRDAAHYQSMRLVIPEGKHGRFGVNARVKINL